MAKQPIKYNPTPDKVALYFKNGEDIIVALADIIYLKADGNYTQVFYNEAGETIKQTICKSIGLCLTFFKAEKIARIHNSYAVNKDWIKSINHHSHYIKLKNKASIPFSQTHVEVVNHFFIRLIVE